MQNNKVKNLSLQISRKELKSFGLIWSAIFLIISITPLFAEHSVRLWSLFVSFLFLLVSFSFPEIYYKSRFYQVWISFGEFIGKINSKIIIIFLFYFIFTPIGLVFKFLKKDLLSKKIDKSSDSYFIDRIEQAGDMKNQF